LDLLSQLQACHQTYQSGNLAAAEQQIGQIVKQFPGRPDAYHLGALIASRMGQNAVALERIDLALKVQKTHPEYLNTKGNILTALQNIPEAIQAYRESLAAKPDYLQAAQNLGRCLIDNDDAGTAIEVYDNALKHHPANEQLQLGHVIALKGAVRSEAALESLDHLDNADQFGYLRGQILLQLNRHDEAIIANKSALQDQRTAAPALQNMMQSYWMQGKWDAGERELKKLLGSTDTPENLFIAACSIYGRAGEPALAEAALNAAEKKYGSSPDILAARARLALEQKDYAAAWQNALAALTARPGNLVLMEVYAEAALVSGRPNEAMIAAHEALKVIPNNQFWIAVKYTAGRAMGQDHKFYADTDLFVKAFQLEPSEKYASIEAFNAELKQALEQLHDFDQHPLDQSLRMGTQTPTDLRFSDVPVIRDFFDALDKPIRTYMAGFGSNAMHPLDSRNTGSYRFAGAWSVKLTAGGHHVNHVHPKGWISSSYYVDVPDEVENEESKAGWIQFGQPPFDVKDQYGNLLGPERFIKPEPGLVVLFPSYLWHGTVPITGKSTRMTLPFDAVPA